MSTPHKVLLVGVDGSAAARSALLWALTRAGADEVVEAVHCWPLQPADGGSRGTAREQHHRSSRLLEHEIAACLVDLDILQPGSRMPQVTAHSVPGRAAKVLLERSADSAMLVLGAAGTLVDSDVVFGRTIGECLLGASTPVMIVDTAGSPVPHRFSAAA
jgi:nucleotide-binding universal stress UspA family protein